MSNRNMFSKKKDHRGTITTCVVMCGILAFGYWLNSEPANTGQNLEELPLEIGSYQEIDNRREQNNREYSEYGYDEENNAVVSNADSAYYLLKEVDGSVGLFYYDSQGKESILRNTDIVFSLMSSADQALFKKGIVVKTEEELNTILQDFES